MAMEQAMPPEAAPAAEAPAEGGGNGVMDLITNISDGLAMLVDAASEAAPEVSQELQSVNDAFKGVIEKIMASQGAGPEAAAQAAPPAAGGMPEAAGAKGAIPVGAPPKGAIPVGRR